MEDQLQARLKQLANDLDIRSPDKLRRAAVQSGIKATLSECGAALK